MGEITSGISILLGSAVVSTIITTIFNQYNNRKNNTLKYITEERKKWRDTIRLISEKIQACEFSGQDEKNIEKYLVELELNINSCGWGNKKDIKEDAYIWDEINQVKKVDNEVNNIFFLLSLINLFNLPEANISFWQIKL